jgi:hypothetical protein
MDYTYSMRILDRERARIEGALDDVELMALKTQTSPCGLAELQGKRADLYLALERPGAPSARRVVTEEVDEKEDTSFKRSRDGISAGV